MPSGSQSCHRLVVILLQGIPIVADFSSVAVFFTADVSTLPCTVMPKLNKPIELHTASGLLQHVPANSRLLCFSAAPELVQRGVLEAQDGVGDSSMKRKVMKEHQFKMAFGLPWTWETFIKKAVESEHLFLKGTGVPWELQRRPSTSMWSGRKASFASLGWIVSRHGWFWRETLINRNYKATKAIMWLRLQGGSAWY